MSEAARAAILAQPFAALPQVEKERRLLPLMLEAHAYHFEACPAYARIARRAFAAAPSSLETLPFLPISLFKKRKLLSVPVDRIRVSVQSSGTSGAVRSSIALDADDARLTSRALASIFKNVLGEKRLPLLVFDTPDALKGGENVGARAAAILGVMPFGVDPTFVLDAGLRLQPDRLKAFLSKYASHPFLVYGFTYLVWQALAEAEAAGITSFAKGILLHSGGWKKMQSLAIDNGLFRRKLLETFEFSQIVNFYGMAEAPGLVMLEGEDGLFHPPHFADILIRDPITLQPLDKGQAGLVEWINPLPRSYPGCTLLTEDIGVIETVDAGAGGYLGKAFRLVGRAPRAELRGCSDVIAKTQEAA